MNNLTLKSPAKVNLFLRIVGKRPDGYHELASLFQTITLHDVIHFTVSKQDALFCTDPLLPTDKSNLIWKAVDLFRRKTSLHTPVKVYLEKRIPMQAGLGGGSSNAATTLWALNQLFGEPANEHQLSQWAGEIGSDVAFFLSQGTAYCTGRGENVQPLPSLQPRSLWIVKPTEGLSTPAVYSKVNLKNLLQRNPEDVLHSWRKGEPHFFNDLEEAAFSQMPTLQDLRQRLLTSGFHTVVLCGSGSSLFCLGNGQPIPGLFSHQASFCNRPPGHWY